MPDTNLTTALSHLRDISPTLLVTSPTLQRASKKAIDIAVNPATEKNAVFQHSILCQTFLPYKNLGDDVRDVQKRQGRAVLSLEAGSIFNPNTESFEKVGLPYGAKARLILSYISTQAVRQQNPVVDNILKLSNVSLGKFCEVSEGFRLLTSVWVGFNIDNQLVME